MNDLCLVKQSTLTGIADGMRKTLNTTNNYTLEEIISILNGENQEAPPIVDGTSLVNYNISFSFSSSLVTIVVIYSTWTDDGIIITTKDISSTTTLEVLQNSTFTIMGVDGTYPLSRVTVSENISDVRSIQTGVYYSYVFYCNGDGSVYFAY